LELKIKKKKKITSLSILTFRFFLFVCLFVKGIHVPAFNVRQVTKFHLKTGVQAKDYSSVAKKEDIKPLELEVLKLEDLLEEINADMKYLRHREGAMYQTNG
jgi:hypothetical protein